MFKELEKLLDLETIEVLKKEKLVIGVSGGPDSIYLLNFLKYLNNKKVIVCCVDYSLRRQSKKEYKYVQEVTKKMGYIFEGLVLDYKITKNVQNEARKIRFDFFLKILIKYKTNILLIATTLNDLIESFYMNLIQKKETPLFKMRSQYNTNLLVVNIFRPLFLLSKRKILQQLKEREIHYFHDESNTSKKFFRNRVRIAIKHEELFPDILRIIKGCALMHDWLYNTSLGIYSKFDANSFSLDKFNNLPQIIQHEILRIFLKKNSQMMIPLRNQGLKIANLNKFLTNNKSWGKYRIGKGIYICKSKQKKIFFVSSNNL